MTKKYNIPTQGQLVSIASHIDKVLNDVKKENISLNIVLNKEQLRQVDEEYYFKYNKGASVYDFVPAPEVEVIISNVKIKFISDNE